MAKLFHLIALVAFPSLLVAGSPDSVRLQYLPEQPVLQSSVVHVELTQGNAAPTVAHQEIRAKLNINDDGKSTVAAQPPLEMNITIESLKVGVDAQGRSVTYDSKHPEGSPLMKEVAKIIGRSLTVAVGADREVEARSNDFAKLARHLEQLGGFRTSNLLSEMLQNVFALAGRNLHVGDEYSVKLALGGDQSVPITLTYGIASITDSEVRAFIHGGFDALEIHRGPIATKANSQHPERLLLAGEIDGKVVWSRKNALVYKTRIDYTYRGSLEEDGQKIPIQLHLRHEDTAKPIKALG